jgi:hypothetical protein
MKKRQSVTGWPRGDNGRARFGVGDALKFLEGLKYIDDRKFDRFNVKFRRLEEQVATVLSTASSRITMVPALMRTDSLAADVIQRLEDKIQEFNQLGPPLDYRTYLASDIWQVVRNDFADPPVNFSVKMSDWFRVTEPYEAFQGAVAVGDVAQWYEEHGDRMFDRNIRKPLGRTQVNQSLIQSLSDEAHNFWYFNNGITILCQELEPVYFSRTSRTPVELRLTGASVVNGAQTVHAIHAASQLADPTSLDGYVSVRVIALRNCPPGFAVEVTKATNTQNRVERRDFSPSTLPKRRSGKTSPCRCRRPTWLNAGSPSHRRTTAARW